MKFEVSLGGKKRCKLRGFVALEDVFAAVVAILGSRRDESLVAGVYWVPRGRDPELVETMSFRRVDVHREQWVAAAQSKIEAARVRHKAADERDAFIRKYDATLSNAFSLIYNDDGARAAFFKNDFATVETFLAVHSKPEVQAA